MENIRDTQIGKIVDKQNFFLTKIKIHIFHIHSLSIFTLYTITMSLIF